MRVCDLSVKVRTGEHDRNGPIEEEVRLEGVPQRSVIVHADGSAYCRHDGQMLRAYDLEDFREVAAPGEEAVEL